jgi:co-chaperonin GroES (HSP10)
MTDEKTKQRLKDSMIATDELPYTVRSSDKGGNRPGARGREFGILRKVNPLGMRVLVEIIKDANVTEGGLYLPEGAKESMQESVLAKVLEVAHASDEDTDEETNVSGVPLGSTVLIPKDAGLRVPWDPMLRIVETEDVLALVDEINIS